MPVEDGHRDGGLADNVLLAAVLCCTTGLHQKLRVTLHSLNLEGKNKQMLNNIQHRGVKSTQQWVVLEPKLTQESRVSVTQRETLVTGDTEGRQRVEPLVQERLEAGGRGVGGMEQVINLLTGRTQSGHWRVDSQRVK